MLMPKMKGLKGLFQKNKHRRRFGIKDYLAMVLIPLALLFVIFIATDNFMLYWFVLVNNDEDLEARRREDFHWYDSSGQSYTPGSSGAPAAPGYTDKFVGGDGLEYAMNQVVSNLSVDEMKTKETAMRFFIYLMDCKGYTPNATIGAMSYMMAEGAALGTFTYESYKYCTGPSGIYYDYTLDNEAWLKWLDGDGFQQAVVLYANMRANGKSVGYAAIGLGLTQESDVWKSDGSKSTHRASDLINFAISKGGYWQYPNIQMLYYEQKFQGDVAWDLDQCPGPDPKSSTEITATEWAGRVLCGIGMPGWKYTLALDSVNYPDSYKSLQNHIKYVPDAEELYNKYSGKDPWFYNPDGSHIYQPSGSSGTVNAPHILEHTCTGDWLCPFCGPTYDNSTPQGLLIARTAVLLAGINRKNGESQILYNGWGYYTDRAKREELTFYRRAHRVTCNDQYLASCDRGVATVIRLSGVDTQFEKAIVSEMQAYMEASDRWECLGTADKVTPQPGDVVAYRLGTNGHITIWTGVNVAGERWPGTTAQMYQASYTEYFPDMANQTPKGNYSASCPYKVYRCVNPEYNSKYWLEFANGNNLDFSDFKEPVGVPKTYPIEPSGS